MRASLALVTLACASLAHAQAAVPRADSMGRALRFDFPGMRIGVAEYEEGPTGTTVFYFPKGVKAAADVRGGAPGTLNSDAARLGYESRGMEAIVFSGGSWYGLSAATGAANAIKRMRAAEGEHDFIVGALGAIIFDVGGRRFTRVTPDDSLGALAARTSREGWFPLGARGAGRFAMQGIYYLNDFNADSSHAWPHSGQGGAFRQIGPTKVAVFTVVNALGTIVGRDGRVQRCRRNAADTPCPAITTMLGDHLKSTSAGGGAAPDPDAPTGPTGNTTITLVVTNQKIPWWALQRLAIQVHGSMARAIQPFATEEDGDVLYAVTTDEVENPSLPPMELGVIASEVAWDAVLASVPDVPAPPTPAPRMLTANELHDLAGVYAFANSGTLAVASEVGQLVATFTGKGRMYFAAGRRYRLIPAGTDRFIVDARAADVLQFERRAGKVVAVTLDPGPWHQTGERRD